MSEPANLSRASGVLETLREEILTGQYRPGERLPSERELSARFGTSRGAVREAIKKLEQIRIVAVHPGGVRVLPLEEATLDILGPLMDLNALPDAVLADQVVQVMSALVIEAAREFVEVASDAQIAHAQTLIKRVEDAPPRSLELHDRRIEFGHFLMTASGNLPMRLIANGVRIQIGERLRATGFVPEIEPKAIQRLNRAIVDALGARDGEALSSAMREAMVANRRLLKEALEAAGATSQGLKLIPAPPSRGLPTETESA